jgi:CHAT domain-containing protein/Tfp pilus assembly protein PilF
MGQANIISRSCTMPLCVVLFHCINVDCGAQTLDPEPTLARIDSLNAAGSAFYAKGNFRPALTSHQSALRLSRESSSQKHIAASLRYLAQSELQVDLYDSSALHAGQLLDIARSIPDLRLEGDALRLLGDADSRRGDNANAEKNYLLSLELGRANGDSVGVSFTLSNLGNVYADRGEFDHAIEYYLSGLELRRSSTDTRSVGLSFQNIGFTYYQTGDMVHALSYFDSARTILAGVPDSTNLGTTLLYIGSTYLEQGDYSRARDLFSQGLHLAEVMRDTFSIGVAWGELANLNVYTGNHSKAIQYTRAAGRYFEQIGNQYNFSASLLNIGSIYSSLGDYSRAIDYFHRSAELKEKIGDQYGLGMTLESMGNIYLQLDSLSRAIGLFRQSLAIADSIGDKPTVARNHLHLGLIAVKHKRYNEARRSLQTSLQFFQTERMKRNEATVLNAFGQLHREERLFPTATEYFSRALAIGKELEAHEIVWQAHLGLGLISEAQNHHQDAAHYYRESINAIERVRGQLGPAEQRENYLALSYSPYEALIGVLARMHTLSPTDGFDREALAVVERSKARSFVELLAESNTDIRRGLTEGQKLDERMILRRIARIQSSLMQPTTRPKQDNDLALQLRKEEENLELFRGELRATAPQYAALSYPDPIDAYTAQRTLLDDNTLLVEFSLGTSNSYLWIVSHDAIRMVSLPGKTRIERESRSLLDELRKQPTARTVNSSLKRINQLGEQLFRTLFSEAARDLKNAKHLIIIPDGILLNLPFEALSVKPNTQNQVLSDYRSSYLCSHLSISYAYSASALAELHKRAAMHRQQNRLALLAYGDPMVPQSRHNLQAAASQPPMRGLEEFVLNAHPLPSTRTEIESIATHFPPEKIKVVLGEAATEDNFKRESLGEYKFVHLATHGLLDDQVPTRSSLLLSVDRDTVEDGLLTMNEVYGLELDADAVILSACETGLGKFVRGEGIVGLTRAFHYAGAQSVVVSMWKIADVSTSEFMQRFYSRLSTGGNISQALREAKLSMMHSSVKLWRHPFHWAAFVLQGGER